MLTSSPASLIGAERPRFEARPPAAYSLGGEAVELAARAGLVLEPWQADGLDLMLSCRDDGKWACPEYGEICARQNGKTAMFFARGLAGLFLLGERLIMWTAHEVKTAGEAFVLVRDLFAQLGVEVKTNVIEIDLGERGVAIVKVSNTNGKEGFSFRTRTEQNGRPKYGPLQRWQFLARSKGSGRGFSGDFVFIDETFAFTPAQQSALVPTLTARPNSQIGYASSPPLDPVSGEVLFKLRRRAESGDPTLGWRDWGEPGDLESLMKMPDDERKAWLEDPARWARTNPALGRGRVDIESIQRNRRALARDEDFAREILGVWPLPPEEGGRVISADAWDALADPTSVLVGEPVLAVEASPQRTIGAIVAGGRNAAGLGHIEVIDHRPGVGWMLERILELDEKHKPQAWLIDPAGPAGSLVQDMRNADLPVREVTGREWSQACQNFHDAVYNPERQLVHLGDDVVARAVGAGRKRDTGDGAWSWGRVKADADITTLCGATLVWHGMPVFYDVLESVY